MTRMPEPDPTDGRVAASGHANEDDATLVRLAREVPISPGSAIDAGADAPARPTASRAFAELVRRHQLGVHLLARSLLHDGAEAQDMAQEAFLRAFRNLDMLADPSKFGVWIRRITFGVCMDWLRAFRPQLFRSGDVRPDAGAAEGTAEPAGGVDGLGDPAPSPLDQVARIDLAGRVMAGLDRLPARYRVPLTLFHIDGLSHAKVAAALGVPEGTTRSLVARARRRLAAELSRLDERAPPASRSPGSPSPLEVLDDPPSPAPRMMHVLNGDVVRQTLERSDLPGAFAVWADVLHEGPVPRQSGTRRWRETRARFIASGGWVTYAEALRRYEEWDAHLARAREYDEVVLWFEHDLFDQLLLVRHLDWFSRAATGGPALSLICIGAFPGIEPFHGLGQLTADQLASLLGTREPVTAAMVHTARDAWQALTADDPSALQELADRLAAGAHPAPPAVPNAGEGPPGERDTPPPIARLPFLAGALRRFLEEYPSRANGLPRTEQCTLECLATGPLSPVDLFRAVQAREERVFMGDWTFWGRLHTLAAGPSPLLALDGVKRTPVELRGGHVALTDVGRDVLGGRADWVSLSGFDRWLGGVHLVAAPGGDVAWRWDPTAERIVRTGA